MKCAVVLPPAMREHVEQLLADESASGDAALARQFLIGLDIQYQAELVPVEFGRLNQFRIVTSRPEAPIHKRPPSRAEAANQRMANLRRKTGQDWRGRR